MDIATDLAARAVSFITLIQDTVLQGSMNKKGNGRHLEVQDVFTAHFNQEFDMYIKSNEQNAAEFRNKTVELVWVSIKPPEDAEATATQYSIKLCKALAAWIFQYRGPLFAKVCTCGSFPAPYIWRQAISDLLYAKGQRRIELAIVLQYLPIQVVLALGGGPLSAHKQRILQGWRMERTDQEALLTDRELRVADEYARELNLEAEGLLKSNEALVDRMRESNVPLSFDLTFHLELDEIEKNRKCRDREQCMADKEWKNEMKHPIVSENDPLERAKEMELFALAFSGGGIRSATLNLGILQGLAEKGWISRFDYLSTVSGGGYIGSWLAAWIKRDGSVMKVSDRLNTQKSADPFGEEVRPIRWLRMFSNYFAPDTSIMSSDAWTVGITWLRNTLLNQLIILLMFLSLLLFINLLFITWRSEDLFAASVSIGNLIGWTTLITLPVAALAGMGMQTYHRERFPPAAFRREKMGQVANAMITILVAGAFVVSAWLFALRESETETTSYFQKAGVLWPAAAVSFIALLSIAIWGRYDRCLLKPNSNNWQTTRAWASIIYTAAFSAVVGLLALGLVWEFFEFFYKTDHTLIALTISKDSLLNKKCLFIVGLPMVIEVFAITVVARMALLGRFFPDERREWWGRMGAQLHRFIFLYLLLAGAALIGQEVLYNFFNGMKGWEKFGLTGGWAAIIGATVKAGFSAATSGKEQKGKPLWLNVLAQVGPYLFALGLFIFLPGLLMPLQHGMEWLLVKISRKLNLILSARQQLPLSGSILTIEATSVLMVLMLFIAYRLAWRLGVNEFSMHHFYRNRLVRAYLGATRRRNDRERTANPFTGFDMQDDLKLHELTNKYGYFGPYPVVNTALNASQVTDLDRQDRKAESFIFSPLYCGFDFSMSRASANIKSKSYDYGMRPTVAYAYPWGPTIGTAMAISGAAVNPNQGYHSSSATAFLLTVFNVQMGWWMGNPRKKTWQQADPTFGLGYIFYNLIGKTNTSNDFVCLSDGGHFDNMGLYEMVRRRCKFILLGDGEQDQNFSCEGLANAIRRCRIDFGAEIIIDVTPITKRNENRYSKCHYVVGSIHYADNSKGKLLYLKSSLTDPVPNPTSDNKTNADPSAVPEKTSDNTFDKQPDKLSVDILEYAQKNPGFPHQTTADQFFDEEQFESYRKLGVMIARAALEDEQVKALFKMM